MPLVWDKETKKRVYKRTTPVHCYQIELDGIQLGSYKTIKQVCNAVNDASDDFNLTDWRVYNVMSGKYSGRINDKWKRLKISKILD